MRRLVRRLFTLCSAVSLLLFVAVVAVWVWSHFAGDGIRWIKYHGGKPPTYSAVTSGGVAWRAGGLRASAGRSPADQIFVALDPEAEGLSFPRWDDPGYPRLVAVGQTPQGMPLSPGERRWYRRYGPFEVRLSDRGPPALGRRQWSYEFVVPLWAVALPCLPLPAAALIRCRRGRARRGLCPICGYDLRASPERCPECGTLPEVAT